MIGNKRAVTHGAYETITLEQLEDAEREQIACEKIEHKEILTNSIKLLLVREARMLRRIQSLMDDGDMVLAEEIHKTGIESGNEVDVKTTRLIATLDKIQTIEAHLTSVQREKTKLIEQLYRLEVSETGNDGTLAEFVRQMDRIMTGDFLQGADLEETEEQ
ncbi:MAG: hypothetical protein GX433_00025 [Deltaproteobacteria bacterium]|nr:hypothetical protein [Deltaproteobacteria bacterium]